MITETSPLPLTKVAAMADFEYFPRSHKEVVEIDHLLEGQHEMRAWEYCMAFSAVTRWRQEQIEKRSQFDEEMLPALDVGGAGTPFYKALRHFGLSSLAIDPHGDLNSRFIRRITAEEAADRDMRAPVVTCVSVIEHTEDHVSFADALARLVQPGGLLFLTADYHDAADREVDDKWHFHWMRKRIYGPERWQWLFDHFRFNHGFRPFGGIRMNSSWEPTVFDYGFASMALVKEVA